MNGITDTVQKIGLKRPIRSEYINYYRCLSMRKSDERCAGRGDRTLMEQAPLVFETSLYTIPAPRREDIIPMEWENSILPA